jgi:hypothetical protein
VRRSGVRIKKRKDNEVELIVAVLDVTAGIINDDLRARGLIRVFEVEVTA